LKKKKNIETKEIFERVSTKKVFGVEFHSLLRLTNARGGAGVIFVDIYMALVKATV